MKNCPKCNTSSELKDMTLKMGGLLCPNCRVILFQPYVDEEYFQEYKRRQEENKKEAEE